MPAPDFTNKYNTPLSPDDEKQFQAWLQRTGRQPDLYDYDLRGAWKDGAAQDPRGHFTDKYKKPNHPTFSDESEYSGKDGFQGGKWQQVEGGKWTYRPSATNLKFRTSDEMESYFKRVEPDSKLLLTFRP